MNELPIAALTHPIVTIRRLSHPFRLAPRLPSSPDVTGPPVVYSRKKLSSELFRTEFVQMG